MWEKWHLLNQILFMNGFSAIKHKAALWSNLCSDSCEQSLQIYHPVLKLQWLRIKQQSNYFEVSCEHAKLSAQPSLARMHFHAVIVITCSSFFRCAFSRRRHAKLFLMFACVGKESSHMSFKARSFKLLKNFRNANLFFTDTWRGKISRTSRMKKFSRRANKFTQTERSQQL